MVSPKSIEPFLLESSQIEPEISAFGRGVNEGVMEGVIVFVGVRDGVSVLVGIRDGVSVRGALGGTEVSVMLMEPTLSITA